MVRRWLVLFALLAGHRGWAQAPSETERLMDAARLWTTVEYFHPYLAYRDIDWDQALVNAIPKIRAASDTAAYRAAIAGMLDELHDPETYVPLGNDGRTIIAGGGLVQPNQPTEQMTSSPQISWIHTASESFFLTMPGTMFQKPAGHPSVTMNENATLPAPLAALAEAGVIDVTCDCRHYQVESTEKIILDLQGFKAVVRLSEPLKPLHVNGTPGVPIPPAPLSRPPSTRYDDPYPPTEARLLAAIKLWGDIHYFFAYKDLVDEDWDEVFASYLPKFIEAHDALDYNLAFASLLTHLADTNTAPRSKTLETYFGETAVGLRIRLLDRYPIVSDVLDTSAMNAGVRPGDVVKRIGSESITDRFRRFVQYIPASTAQRSGYDTVQRITNGPAGSEVELTIENAKGEAHVIKLVRQPMPGVPQRTTEAVRVLSGNVGYMDLDRLSPDEAEKALERLKDTRAIIFDLRGRAPAAAMVASHLTAAANTAAVALVTTPIALHPDVATGGVATQTTSTFLVQTLPAAHAPLYKGKTLALIDERTTGDSEYAGLLLVAANKTEFVGAPSAGAESSLAELPLPGGITVTYSTQDVREGNGGKLQRLGLQPNIVAPTTAMGLRAGKDEALEAALNQLAQVRH